MARLTDWLTNCTDTVASAINGSTVDNLGIDRSLVNVDIDLENNLETPEDNSYQFYIRYEDYQRAAQQRQQARSMAAIQAQQQVLHIYNSTGNTVIQSEDAQRVNAENPVFTEEDLDELTSDFETITALNGVSLTMKKTPPEWDGITGIDIVDLDPEFSEIVENNFWELMSDNKKEVYVTPYIYEVTLDHQIGERDEGGAYVYKYKGERRTADSNILRFKSDDQLIREEIEDLFSGTYHINNITGAFRTTTVNENGE
jgi:hypothetical protein